MHTNNLFANHATYWHRVEDVCEIFEQPNVVASLDVIEEPIHLVDAGTLVIPSKQEEVLLVDNFVAVQQDDRFNAVLSTINIVPKEEVVRLRWKSAFVEDPQQVVVLAMRIATDANRWLDFKQHGLRHKYFAHLVQHCLDLLFLDKDLLLHFVALDEQHLLN